MSEIDEYKSVAEFAKSKKLTFQAIYQQIKRDVLQKDESKKKLVVKKIGSLTLVKEK